MESLYWITRFDSICGFLFGVGIIFGVLTIIFGIGYLVNLDDSDKTTSNALRKRTVKNLIITIIIGTVSTFIPTTKEALVIYGAGGAIDYIKSDSTAKQLPDKCINALDKWVDSYVKEENK